MRFLVDNQLPPALARYISGDLQAEASHVADVGLRNASDAEVWAYASEHDCVLITKDDDFVTLYSVCPSARLLWVRLGNRRRVFLLRVFGEQWPRILKRFEDPLTGKLRGHKAPAIGRWLVKPLVDTGTAGWPMQPRFGEITATRNSSRWMHRRQADFSFLILLASVKEDAARRGRTLPLDVGRQMLVDYPSVRATPDAKMPKRPFKSAPRIGDCR